MQLLIIIEMFQYIAIGPVFYAVEDTSRAVPNVFMLDFVKAADRDERDYWAFLGLIIALVFVWFLMVVLILLNFQKNILKWKSYQRLIQLLNALFLPFYGNACFILVISALLDPLVCIWEAQGDAFVYRDC